jgi:hypothetical protein
MHERAYCCKTVQTLQLFERARTVRFPTACLPRATWPMQTAWVGGKRLNLEILARTGTKPRNSFRSACGKHPNLDIFQPTAGRLTRPPVCCSAYPPAQQLASLQARSFACPFYTPNQQLASLPARSFARPFYTPTQQLTSLQARSFACPFYTPNQQLASLHARPTDRLSIKQQSNRQATP